jgi:hypothetical protein
MLEPAPAQLGQGRRLPWRWAETQGVARWPELNQGGSRVSAQPTAKVTD